MATRKKSADEAHEHEDRCPKCDYCKCCGRSKMDYQPQPYWGWPYRWYTVTNPPYTVTNGTTYRFNTTASTAQQPTNIVYS